MILSRFKTQTLLKVSKIELQSFHPNNIFFFVPVVVCSSICAAARLEYVRGIKTWNVLQT